MGTADGQYNPKGSKFPIMNDTASDAIRPDVAYNLNMNEFIVVYAKDLTNGTGTNAFDIYGIRLKNEANSTGGIIGGSEKAIDNSSNEQFYARVATYRLNHDTPYLVIFRDKWNDVQGDIRGYLVNKEGNPVQLLNISTQPNVIESYARIHSNEERGGYAVVWHENHDESGFDVKWRSISHDGILGSTGVVTQRPFDEGFPDIVNSMPFPFATWESHAESNNYDVFGRFLYQKTFLPSVLRHP